MDAAWFEAEPALHLLAGKWVLKILRALDEKGPLRHNELLRNVPGIRPAVLSENLRRLEAAQLIVRDVTATAPPAVSYQLTAAAPRLFESLEALASWGRRHLAAARGEQDLSTEPAPAM